MRFITINNRAHAKLKLIWYDILGDSTVGTDHEFEKMKCARIITECYLYDMFESEGSEYVRTFASYQIEEEMGYGDRNVYPMEVFTIDSQRSIRNALKLMKRRSY